jgi:SEC-C motif-containing protein
VLSPICPCGTGRPLADCCGPFVQLAAEPPDPVALMRSRYTAFALGQTEWLWRSLHEGYEDRARPEAEVRAELARACRTYKYRGLWILDHDLPAPDRARVLFFVRLYEKGKARSFVERSDFQHQEAGWRYRGGRMLAASGISGDPLQLRLATFPEE